MNEKRLNNLILRSNSLTKTGNYNKSITLIERVIDYCYNNQSEISNILFLGLAHENLGYICAKKNLIDNSINEFKKSLNYLKKLNNVDLHISRIYNHLGNAYSINYDYHRAIECFEKVLIIYKKNNHKNIIDLASLYNNIAAVYAKLSYNASNKDLNYINKTIKFYNKALSYLVKSENPLLKNKIYNNLSVFYTKWGYYENAIKYLKRILGKKIDIEDKHFLSIVYHNYGIVYFRKGKFILAKKYIYRSINLKLEIGDSNHSLYRNYKLLGEIEYNKKSYIQALQYLLKAINCISTKNYKSIYSIIDPQKLYLYYELIEILQLRVRVIRSMYFKTKRIKYLKLAFENYKQVLTAIDAIRRNYSRTNTKEIFSQNLTPFFEEALTIAYEIFVKTGNVNYQNIMFSIMERSKSMILLDEIASYESKHKFNVPQNIVIKENEIKSEIGFYQKILFNEKKEGRSKNISSIKEKIFELNENLDQLIEHIERNYKDYFNYKYNYSITNIDNLQNILKNDELLVEYFIGDEFIFICAISKKHFTVKKIKKSKYLDRRMRRYRNLFSSTRTEKFNYLKSFVATGHYFYKLLLKDILSEYNKVKSLVIIPDGLLNYVPFEVLLTKKPNKNPCNFKVLDYLLEKYDISYSYSATLFCRNTRKSNKSNKILSFAPTFSASNPEREDALRSGLESLKWNKKEASLPAKYFDSRSYKGKYATKKNFIENASKYSILHLATHGVVEDSNPMFSKIAFAPNNKSVDEGYLHAYELYNMKLNTKLSILSACETGYGKLVKGEGVMSIARGFLFAGSRSIMMSLWQVSDYATYKIVNYFYKSLSEGLNKDEALRQAKLKYIKSSDKIKSNPAYWAPFVLIGDTRPL